MILLNPRRKYHLKKMAWVRCQTHCLGIPLQCGGLNTHSSNIFTPYPKCPPVNKWLLYLEMSDQEIPSLNWKDNFTQLVHQTQTGHIYQDQLSFMLENLPAPTQEPSTTRVWTIPLSLILHRNLMYLYGTTQQQSIVDISIPTFSYSSRIASISRW